MVGVPRKRRKPMSVRQRFNIPRDFNKPPARAKVVQDALNKQKAAQVAESLAPCSADSATAALNAIGMMFGYAGEDAQAVMIWHAVNAWYAKREHEPGHPGAHRIALEAEARIAGKAISPDHLPADERAALNANAERELAAWTAAGFPGLLYTINLRTERLLARHQKDPTE